MRICLRAEISCRIAATGATAWYRQGGYAEQEQTWGSYPDVYVKVYEAPPNAKAAFPFVAIINLVYVPHRVFVRSLGDLIQLLNMLMPLFEHHSRPDQEVGDALVGTNDAGD
jgi:hypothetical protein